MRNPKKQKKTLPATLVRSDLKTNSPRFLRFQNFVDIFLQSADKERIEARTRRDFPHVFVVHLQKLGGSECCSGLRFEPGRW